MAKNKKKFGDRADAKLIRDIDLFHFYSGMIYPNRTDNEVFISVKINLEKINKYIEKKNENLKDNKYKLFHVILCALLKTIVLRPQLNRFIVNGKYYQRNKISTAFVVKKQFNDNSEEGLAYLVANENSNIDTIKDLIYKQINSVRNSDSLLDTADTLAKIPRPILRQVLKIGRFLDKRGKFLVGSLEGDPYRSSVLVTNLGSIGLDHVYHHLTNWGTTSLLCSIGKKRVEKENGEVLDLGFTIDERITDGYYCAKSISLLQDILSKPEILDLPFGEQLESK